MTAVLYDVPGPRARRRALIGGVIGTLAVVAVGLVALWRLADQGQFESSRWEPLTRTGILEGLFRAYLATIRAAVLAILLALVFGVVFASARLSERPWVRAPAVVIVEFFRSVPLLLLILFVFLGFSSEFDEFGDQLSRALPDFVVGFVGIDEMATMGPLVVALMLYNGSVLAEIFRAGILAVPKGQSEAAYAIGLRKTQVMRLVLVPQSVRIMLPAIISQSVVALKDTALGSIIGYNELVRQGRLVYDSFFNILPTMFVIATIYVATNMALSRLAIWMERRQSRKYGAEAVEQVEAAVDIH